MSIKEFCHHNLLSLHCACHGVVNIRARPTECSKSSLIHQIQYNDLCMFVSNQEVFAVRGYLRSITLLIKSYKTVYDGCGILKWLKTNVPSSRLCLTLYRGFLIQCRMLELF